MQFQTRNAINTVVTIGIIIVIIAAAAGAYYFLGMPATNNTSSSTKTGTGSSTSGPATSSTSSSQSSTTYSSTSTSATSSAVTSTTSTTASTSSLSSTSTCTGSTYTSSTGTYTAPTLEAVVPLVQAISAMTVEYNYTSGGQTYNYTTSYHVLSTTSSGGLTSYKLYITSTVVSNSTMSYNVTALLRSDGTAAWVDINGYNDSSSYATFTLIGMMTPFTVEVTLASEISIYTSTQFTKTSTSTMTFGSTTMSVDTYQPITLPMTISECTFTQTLTQFLLEVGTVPGTTITLATLMHVVGTYQSGSTTSSEDFLVRVTSITKA